MLDTVVCELLSLIAALERAGEQYSTELPRFLFPFVFLLFLRSLYFVCVFECKENRSVCESPKGWLCSLQPPVNPPECASVNEPSVPFWIWI